MSSEGHKSVFSELWNRRVPQFVATYIGICWGILQFLIFASNRYQLDNQMIDKFLIFAVVLLPAVFVFIYNHGRPGKDKWKSYEKILIPLNLVLALVFAGLFDGNNAANAAPMEVQVTNEEGDTVTRLVPAVSQTKSFLVFPLASKTNDPKSDWLKFMLPRMVKRDLEQDMRMYGMGPYSLDYDFKSNNADIRDNNIPFSKHLKIAKDRIVDYFIIGDFASNGDRISGSIKVYETKSGELFHDESFSDKSYFDVVDDFSKNLMDNLFLKDNTEKILVTDLPVSDLISANTEALKYMTLARNKASLDGNLAEAMELIAKAAEADPESPMILSEQASYFYSNGKVDTSTSLVEKAINLSEFLPERQKFTIRQQYYQYKLQMDKYIAILETWRKLYPRDYYPYNQLIEYYKLTQVINKAKQVAEDALENGHGARVLKRLAGFEIAQNNLEKAEAYIDEYYALFPDKNKLEDKQLPDLYLKKGEFDKAQKWYEQILLLNPNDHDLMIKMSEVLVRKWEYKAAENQLRDALKTVTIKEDSLNVLRTMIYFYFRTGEADKFADMAAIHFNLASPADPRISSAFQHLQLGGVYEMFSMRDKLLEYGQLIQDHAPQLYPHFTCIANFVINLVSEDKEAFVANYTDNCKATITRGTPTLEYLAEGYLAKMDGDYEEAIRLLETYIDTTGQDSDMFGGWVAECHRLNKDYKTAISYCKSSLKAHPSEATILTELAKCYHETGRTDKALDIIQDIKTKIWYNADERYTPYKLLLEFENEITS